jgi:N-acetylglucosaminyl-diphospho-decaprenol L-rhamnosyltransferase
MSGPEVAVAVVSWNTRELLDRCLRSLEPVRRDGRAEVWVVDNDSGDGSAEMVRREHPEVELIAAEENLGFGRAVNRVAARTAAPWIAAANADVELERGALSELLAAGRRHPEAGAVAPRLVLPDGSTQHSVHPFPTIPFTALFNSGLPGLSAALGDRLCLEGAWRPERERVVPWAIGAFLLVRRAAWDEVGGFSEAQWMYAEDLDLGWRLARRGRTTVFVPSAVVRHHSRASTSQAWGQDTDERWMQSTYAWMLERRGSTRTTAVAALNVAGAAARAAGLAVLARISPGRYASRRDEMRRWARLHRLGLRPRELARRVVPPRGSSAPR